jgi:hypothetical protein
LQEISAMIQKLAFASLMCFLPALAPAQARFVLSDSARVSLLTVSPGSALYSTFGHSALRFYDPRNRRIDRCYNFGTFDFDQPNFYLNFCRGRLLYALAVEPYAYFEYGAFYDHRNVQEQLLALDSLEKQNLFDRLQENALPENRDYRYDFFYDNCSTRLRDVLISLCGDSWKRDSTFSASATMRDLLQPYLSPLPWTKFGINLILGMPADNVASREDHLFLPDYLHHFVMIAQKKDTTPLLISERLNPNPPFPLPAPSSGGIGGPTALLLGVSLFGFATLFNTAIARWFDRIFWCALGICGLVIALLWFGTDHAATRNNLNLFWALPTHLIFFNARSETRGTRRYWRVTAVLAALLFFWLWLPQRLPLPILPLLFLIVAKAALRTGWIPSNRYKPRRPGGGVTQQPD